MTTTTTTTTTTPATDVAAPETFPPRATNVDPDWPCTVTAIDLGIAPPQCYPTTTVPGYRSSSNLPNTGTESALWALAALAIIVCGITIVIAARQIRKASTELDEMRRRYNPDRHGRPKRH